MRPCFALNLKQILHILIFITDFMTPVLPCSIVEWKPLRYYRDVKLFLRMYRSQQDFYLTIRFNSQAILVALKKIILGSVYVFYTWLHHIFVFMFGSTEELQQNLYGCNKIWVVWLQACSRPYTRDDWGIYFLAVSWLYGQICVWAACCSTC